MTEFLKMDIFFAVTTVESIIITALLAFLIMRVLKILEHIERLAKAAGDEAEHMQADVAYIRGKIRGIIDAFSLFLPRRRTRSKSDTDTSS